MITAASAFRYVTASPRINTHLPEPQIYTVT